MASSNIPEKTIERLSEYRRTLLSCHKQGITHLLPRAGRHPRHHGGAGAPRPDAHRLFERHEEGLRREGAHRFHQQHPRQRHGDQHRRHRHGTPRPGHHQVFQRPRPESEDHHRVRHRPREGRPDDRRHSVPPYGDIRGGGRGQGHRHRHRLVSLARSRRTGRPDRQRRHQGRAQLHLAAAQLPARHRGRELRHHHAAPKRSPISSRRTRRTRPTTEPRHDESFPRNRPAPPHSATRRLPSDRSTAYTAVTASCSRPCAASPANATAKVSSSHSRPTRASYSKHRPICACSRRSTRRSGCSNGPASTIWSSSLLPANSAGRVPPISSAAT